MIVTRFSRLKAQDLKLCKKCGIKKPRADFRLRPYSKSVSSPCRDCVNKQRLAWRHSTSSRRKSSALVSRYRISAADYSAMLEAQRGVCAISQHPPEQKRLFVDHDHETGVVRGLLCYKCNTGLGCFEDNPAMLRAAAEYLETRKERAR